MNAVPGQRRLVTAPETADSQVPGRQDVSYVIVKPSCESSLCN